MEERSGSFLPELPYTNRGVIRQKEELSALIDWCQITIKEVPLEAVIEDVLRIPLEFMTVTGYEKKNKTSFEPIPHFYPHALRHTFATRCFEVGIEAKVVQGFLGHYSIAITLDLYTHVTDNKAKSEMEKLQNLYEDIV